MPERLEINRRLVDVDGGRLSIFRFGPLVEMPVVVAVHGITGSSYSWTAVARALGESVGDQACGRPRSSPLSRPSRSRCSPTCRSEPVKLRPPTPEDR